MANTDSAKKALRQTKKRTVANLKRKRAYKEAVKATVKAVESGAKDDAKKLVVAAQKTLDKAAKSGVIKKKAAGRKLSRLMKKVNA